MKNIPNNFSKRIRYYIFRIILKRYTIKVCINIYKPTTPKTQKKSNIHNIILYIYKAYINTYTYNHQSYKAFKVGFYLRGLLFVC